MSKYRVMIIDDDDDARKMLGLVLQPRYEIVEAYDGLDALSKLETHEPDFAIIDIMMPMMDGYQVCEAIRRHPRFNTMQVMFLSAHGSKENIQRSYAAGANLFLTKPVDPARILKNIDFTIEHEPPPMHRKRYTLKELQALEVLRKDSEKVSAHAENETPQPRFTQAASSTASPRPAPAAAAVAAAASSTAQAHPFRTSSTTARPAYTARPQNTPQPQAAAPRTPETGFTRPAAEAANQATLRPRVLAVDDDPEMLRMLELALRDYYEVTRACNGIDAIERMVDYEPDLMLLDVMMPRMNGYQLLQSLRRNAYFRTLPVVVLSAKSGERDREYAARLGANEFLPKPYHMEELLVLLQGITHAPDFRVRPKKMTMLDIKERLYAEDKERKDREHAAIRQQKFAEMKNVFQQAGDASPTRRPEV